MSESVYRVTEVIGTSPESWEAAARNAVDASDDRHRRTIAPPPAAALASPKPRLTVSRSPGSPST